MKKQREQLPLRGMRPLDGGSIHLLSQITIYMVQVFIVLIANFFLEENGIKLDNPNPTPQDIKAFYTLEYILRVATQIVLICTPLVYCFVTGVNFKREINFKQGLNVGQGLLLVPISLLCIVAFMPIATLFVNGIVALGFEIPAQLSFVSSTGMYILSLIVVAILPAFCEEVMFRGFIARGLRKFGVIVAIFVSSLIFAIAHGSLLQLVHQFFLGMVLFTVYFATKSIYASMTIHAVNNFVALTVNFILFKTTGSENIDIPLEGAPLVFTLLGVSVAGMVILALVMWAFIVISKKRQDKYVVDNFKKYYEEYDGEVTTANARALVEEVNNRAYGKHNKRGTNFITRYFDLIRYLNFSFEENKLEEESKSVEELQFDKATSEEDKKYYGDLLKAKEEKNRRWDRNMVLFGIAFSVFVLLVNTIRAFKGE